MGNERAALLYRRFVEHALSALEIDVIYIDREQEREAFSLLFNWPMNRLRVQMEGDIGARMNHALTQELQSASRVVLIGSDTPSITQGDIKEAFEALGTADLVIGPTNDGGYYLIGLASPHQELFTDIAWSSGQELTQTLERAKAHDLRVATLSQKTDVDTLKDLQTSYPEYLRH